MQHATSEGLRAATDDKERRWVISCVHNGNDDLKRTLINMWSTKTPPEALKILAAKDVLVTNQSDKEQQLPKLRLVNDQVRAVMAQESAKESAPPSLPISPSKRNSSGAYSEVSFPESPSSSTPERRDSGTKRQLHPPMTPVSEDWSTNSPALIQQMTGLSDSMASLSQSSQQQIAELSRTHDAHLADLSKAHSAEMSKMGPSEG